MSARRMEAPRQHDTSEENKHIKETGTAPEKWKEKPHKLCQKDIDARWTKKNNPLAIDKERSSFKEKFEYAIRISMMELFLCTL